MKTFYIKYQVNVLEYTSRKNGFGVADWWTRSSVVLVHLIVAKHGLINLLDNFIPHQTVGLSCLIPDTVRLLSIVGWACGSGLQTAITNL
jgi:hypothetical protein